MLQSFFSVASHFSTTGHQIGRRMTSCHAGDFAAGARVVCGLPHQSWTSLSWGDMLSGRLSMPASRSLPWPLKPVASAKTALNYDAHGRMVMDIRHDLLKGITPEMIAWWFANIGGEIEIEGRRLSKYHVWHPHDHIHWELAKPGPDGRASVGAKFRIVEAFGRNPAYYIDVIDTVTRLDASGITIVGHRLGCQVSHLNHDFIAVRGGTQYVSRLTLGIMPPIGGRLVNRLIHGALFSEEMGRAWLRHNIEEVGLLEHILPLIFARPV
jgi:hypothetical protein